MDDTFYIIIGLLLLGGFLVNPAIKRFRRNREKEQRRPEKHHLTS